MISGPATKIRLVRCPKCWKLLPEVAGIPLYQCGGCGVFLRAKNHGNSTKTTPSGSHETGSVQRNELVHVSENEESSSSSREAIPSSRGECSLNKENGRDDLGDCRTEQPEVNFSNGVSSTTKQPEDANFSDKVPSSINLSNEVSSLMKHSEDVNISDEGSSSKVQPEEVNFSNEVSSPMEQPEDVNISDEGSSSKVQPEDVNFSNEVSSPMEQPEDVNISNEGSSSNVHPEDVNSSNEVSSPMEQQPEDVNISNEGSSSNVQPKDVNFSNEVSSPMEQQPEDVNISNEGSSPNVQPEDANFSNEVSSPMEQPEDVNISNEGSSSNVQPEDVNISNEVSSPTEQQPDTNQSEVHSSILAYITVGTRAMTSSSSISHLFRSVLGSPKKDQIKSNKTIPTGQSDAERYGLPADRIHVSDDSITGKRQKLAGETGITHPTAYFIKQRFFERYDLGKILGKGASAEVYLARHKRTGEKFAVKIIHRNNRMNDESTMATEVQILKAVQHTNVVSLFEIFETRDTIYLVLELAEDGDLIGGLAELPIYNEESIKDIFHQLLLAVHHLHERGIIHRDLKLDNLLYSRTDEDKIHVKITDFGLSAIVDETYFTKRSDNYSHSSHSSHSTSNDKNSSQRMKREKVLNQMWGTTEYFAPEVYARAYGRQADVWALGCILFEMLTGELAFPYRETPVGLMERVLLHGGKKPLRAFERKAGWQALSKEAKSLIKGMLKTSPVKRLSIEECLQHPWMQALHHKQQQQKMGLKLRHSSSNMSMTNTDSSSSSSPALSPSSSSHHSNANGNNDLSVCSVAFQYGEESSHNVGSPASTAHASSPLRMADEAERVAKGELVVARRIITERVDRRARRYNHLVAEVAMRPARLVSP